MERHAHLIIILLQGPRIEAPAAVGNCGRANRAAGVGPAAAAIGGGGGGVAAAAAAAAAVAAAAAAAAGGLAQEQEMARIGRAGLADNLSSTRSSNRNRNRTYKRGKG